jgi:hypothetical protein
VLQIETSIHDISHISLAEKLKLTGRKKQRAQILTSERRTVMRNTEIRQKRKVEE